VSRKESPDSLGKRIDDALASWPLRDRGARAWEDMARRIETKIAAVGASRAPIGPLLDAPLPTEPEEAHVDDDRPTPRSMRATSTRTQAERRLSQPPVPMERERDRRSLKDLAKLAGSPSLTPAPPSLKGTSSAPPPSSTRTNDSGIVDLKQMGVLDEPAPRSAGYHVSGGPSGLGATGGMPGGAPSSSRYPAPPPLSGRPAAPALSVPAPRTRAPSFNPYEKKKKGGGLWVGMGAVVTLAAAAVLVLTPYGAKLQARFRPLHPSAPAISAVAPPPSPPEAVATAASAPQPPPPALSVAAGGDAPPPPTSARAAADPTIPAAPTPAPASALTHAGAPAAHRSVSVSGGGEGPAKPPASPPPNPALIARNIPTSSPQSSSFDNALRQAAGPIDTPSGDSNKSLPASAVPSESGNVPQKPSSGAIAAGVGAVMGQARGCLTSGDPVSFASVTFGSSGAVSSVTVSGSASGKAAEGCIKAALGRAKVPAFAQPSYTQKFTVRPN
jgi:hypothetical protein